MSMPFLPCVVSSSCAHRHSDVQIGKAAAGVVLDKINPKWALVAVLVGAGGFNSLMAMGSSLTWFNVTWFLSRAVYVSFCLQSPSHTSSDPSPFSTQLLFM